MTVDAALSDAELMVAGPAAVAAVDAALVAGSVILASDLVGVAEHCLELAVDYLKTRYQFGRPIGSFQALKHRMADQWTLLTQARALARYAAACLADADPDTAVAASVATAYTSVAAVRAAEECVQIHGGIGFTLEYPIHLYLERAKADALALGTARVPYSRLAGLLAFAET